VNDTVVHYDVDNHTASVRNPADDEHVGAYFRRLPNDSYLPTWYELRTNAAKAMAQWPDVDAKGNPLPDNAKRCATEKTAANRAAAHAGTPSTAHFDALGRPFLTLAHNRVVCADHPLHNKVNESYATRVDLDIEGNQQAVLDERRLPDPVGLPLEEREQRIVMRYAYDMLGNRIQQQSMEAGAKWMLNDVAGKPIRAWDSRGHHFSTVYDALRRPVEQWVRGSFSDPDPLKPNSDPRTLNPADPRGLLVDRIEYGEPPEGATPAELERAELLNLRTRILRHFDSAGLAISARLDGNGSPSEAYDFKGNLLRSTRRLARSTTDIPDWNQPAEPQLELERFEASSCYDALNRPIQSVAPRSSLGRGKVNVSQPVFNEANLLEAVDVWLEQPTEPAGQLNPSLETPSKVGVLNIDHDAKGQRLRIDYKNGTSTRYSYDPLTYRLTKLLTGQVQNLHYTYDPAGNISHIRDDAQQTIFFKNKLVEPSNDYVYDALYRLVQATGREHLGQNGKPIPHSYNDAGRVGLLSADATGRFAPNDGQAMGTYSERYVYDAVGNFVQMQHRGDDPANPGWIRRYTYNETSLLDETSRVSNRLSSTQLGNGVLTPAEVYDHDVHGNMLTMPHLQLMVWDYRDQLRLTQRQKVNDDGAEEIARHGERTWYTYDASGQRVRKVTELANNGGIKEERIYLGGYEVYRSYTGASKARTIELERETLHVMDNNQRIALVETRTLTTNPDPKDPHQLIRYQQGNHLGSASLELDDQGQIITYEEYAPYGSTTYQAVRSHTETAKRHRYTAKERDEESELNYHGARYYAAWMGSWIACDPDCDREVNSYSYARCRVTLLRDSNGREPDLPEVIGKPPTDCGAKKCHTSFPTHAGWTGDWSDVGSGAVKAAKGWAIDIFQGVALSEKPINMPSERVLAFNKRLEELRPEPPRNDSEWLGFILADTALTAILGPESAAEAAELDALKEATTSQRVTTALARTEAEAAVAQGTKEAKQLEQRMAKELERLKDLEAKSATKESKLAEKFRGFRAKPFLIPTALQEKVQKLHAALDKIAQSRKTTALGIIDSPDGMKLVVASSDKNVPSAIRELAQKEGIEVLQGTGHAEATIIDAAKSRGWNLKAIAPSRDFCANCWFRSLATDAELMGNLKDRAFKGRK
jgi:RHS repeat-associated protein